MRSAWSPTAPSCKVNIIEPAMADPHPGDHWPTVVPTTLMLPPFGVVVSS